MRWLKNLGTLAASVFAIGACSFPAATKEEPTSVYEGLRSMALHASAADLGLTLPEDTITAYGVVMDMGVSSGTATLVAFSTGDASLYFSNGGGVIGAGRSDSVKQSSRVLVQNAQAHLESFTSTARFDKPSKDQVRFYILTNRGVLTAVEIEDEINSGQLQLSPVWFAGQKLITDIRMAPAKP